MSNAWGDEAALGSAIASRANGPKACPPVRRWLGSHGRDFPRSDMPCVTIRLPVRDPRLPLRMVETCMEVR
jgi:hypothetical protein